jgi:hypothetical protein
MSPGNAANSSVGALPFMAIHTPFGASSPRLSRMKSGSEANAREVITSNGGHRKASTRAPWAGGQQIRSHEPGAWQAVAPSAVPHGLTEDAPTALDRDGLKRVRGEFAGAAIKTGGGEQCIHGGDDVAVVAERLLIPEVVARDALGHLAAQAELSVEGVAPHRFVAVEECDLGDGAPTPPQQPRVTRQRVFTNRVPIARAHPRLTGGQYRNEPS